MENKYRVNFQVDTEVPQEFFFSFFILSITKEYPNVALKDISVSSLNFLAKTRKLEDEREFKSYRFVSIAQILREMPLEDTLAKLTDKDFSHHMRLRFEKAKIETKQKLMSLFSIENHETICEVYQDCLLRWSIPVEIEIKKKKERKTGQSRIFVLVGYCIVP